MRALLVLALLLDACGFGPGTALPPDPVGADTTDAVLLAAFDALPPPSRRPPYLAATADLVPSGELAVPRGFVAERLAASVADYARGAIYRIRWGGR